MKYTDEQLKEFMSGHHLCGWVADNRTSCDCEHYDDLYLQDPEIAQQIVDFIKRDKENS